MRPLAWQVALGDIIGVWPLGCIYSSSLVVGGFYAFIPYRFPVFIQSLLIPAPFVFIRYVPGGGFRQGCTCVTCILQAVCQRGGLFLQALITLNFSFRSP
jgi:hypothetical protein